MQVKQHDGFRRTQFDRWLPVWSRRYSRPSRRRLLLVARRGQSAPGYVASSLPEEALVWRRGGWGGSGPGTCNDDDDDVEARFCWVRQPT